MSARNRKVLASLLLISLGAASLGLIGCDSRGAAIAADLSATAPAPPEPGELDRAELDALFEHMDENGADVRSGHLVVITRTTHRSLAHPPWKGEQREEMWFDGRRVRIEKRETTPRGRMWRDTIVFDGDRLTTVSEDSSGRVSASVSESADLERVAYETGFGVGDMLMRWPLNAAAWGGQPHGSRLAGREVWLPRLIGEEQIGGLACTRLALLLKHQDPETTTYESLWVAPNRGHAAARYERHTIYPAEGRSGAYGEVWQVAEWLHPTEGLWLPSVVTHRRYEQPATSGYSSLIEWRAEIVSSEFNAPIPDDVFHIEIPPEAELVPERQLGRPPRSTGASRGG
jgi:hypothetical protein